MQLIFRLIATPLLVVTVLLVYIGEIGWALLNMIEWIDERLE